MSRKNAKLQNLPNPDAPREQAFAIGSRRFKVPVPSPDQIDALKKAKALLDRLPQQLTDLLVGATAIGLLKQDNRLLRRQVRILRAELRCQKQMWLDAGEGKRVKLKSAGRPDRDANQEVEIKFIASAIAHAQKALDCATRAAKGQRNPPVTDKNFKRARRR